MENAKGAQLVIGTTDQKGNKIEVSKKGCITCCMYDDRENYEGIAIKMFCMALQDN